MRISDDGFLIHKKPFSENKVLLSFFTPCHGRVNGIARASKRHPLDIGYYCALKWSAKLDHQLGFIEYDFIASPQSLLAHDYQKLLAFQSAVSLLYHLLVEHHPYPLLYKAFNDFIDNLAEDGWLYAYVQFEKKILEQLGFGLSLHACAVEGCRDKVVYLSPRSWRAVCAASGEPYKDKLFSLPVVLIAPEGKDFKEALRILGYFIKHHLLEGRSLMARDLFINAIE